METMDTPMTRADFERRFHLLTESIRHQRIHFASMEMTQGLQKVRKLPNGRIDFLSVNESARLQANMQNQFDADSFNKLIKDTKGQDEATKSQLECFDRKAQQASKVGRNDP